MADPLIEYWREAGNRPASYQGNAPTVIEMDRRLRDAFALIARGDERSRRRADFQLDKAEERERLSKTRAPRIWTSQGRKRVYQFNDETDWGLIFKEFDRPGKTAWLYDFWEGIYRDVDPGILAGEICARTERRLLSLFFKGGNLGYEHLALEQRDATLDGRVAELLLEKNDAAIARAEDFMREKGLSTERETYVEKWSESILLISQATGAGKRALQEFEEGKSALSASLLGDAEMVPYTDFKMTNIVLESGNTVERMLRTEAGLRSVDADKIDHRITFAHNIAHIAFAPELKLALPERMGYYGLRGLLERKERAATILSIAYYLMRQAGIMANGSRVPVASWAQAERSRYEGFYGCLREVLPLVEELGHGWAGTLLGRLPSGAPPWPQS